jgi:long-chain acyl-CoA synthetase
VKLKLDHAVTETVLLAFLEAKLNRLELPREIIFKDTLPKTLVGKLSKKELREEYKAMKGHQS